MNVTAESVYGMTPQAPSWGVAAPTQRMSSDELAGGGWRDLIDPANPLVWFGAVLFITVGVIGFAGRVRVGKAAVSVDVGTA